MLKNKRFLEKINLKHLCHGATISAVFTIPLTANAELFNSKNISALNKQALDVVHESYHFAEVYHWSFEQTLSDEMACLLPPKATTIDPDQCATSIYDISFLKLQASTGIPADKLKAARETDEAFVLMPEEVIDAEHIKQWQISPNLLITTLVTREARLYSLTICKTPLTKGEVDINNSVCRDFQEDSELWFGQQLQGQLLEITGQNERYTFDYQYQPSSQQFELQQKEPRWFQPTAAETVAECWQLVAFSQQHTAETFQQALPKKITTDIAESYLSGKALYRVLAGPFTSKKQQHYFEWAYPDAVKQQCTLVQMRL